MVLFVWIVIFLTFNVTFSRWKLKYDIKAAAIDSVATGYLADTIANQNNIQLFNGYNFESQGYKKVTNEQAKVTEFAWNLDAVIEGGQAFRVHLETLGRLVPIEQIRGDQSSH